MSLKVSHIAAAIAGTVLLAGGCVGRRALDTGAGEIRFEARMAAGGTKATAGESLDLRTDFSSGGQFAVTGWHEGDGTAVFAGPVTVTRDGEGYWTYSDPPKWHWTGDTDHYDFLAVADPDKTYPAASADGKQISVPYDPTATGGVQRDILMAGLRRRGGDPYPSDVVPLRFRHALCAVKVIFYKEVVSQPFSLTSFKFTRLLTSGDLLGTIDNTGELRISLGNAVLDESDEGHFGKDFETGDAAVLYDDKPSYDPYQENYYDLILPQDLNIEDPQLLVKFVYQDDEQNEYQFTESVPLKDIPAKGSDTPITRWESGKKYIYEIHISLHGGIQAIVTTTDWDVVHAQTPGLNLQ